MRSLVQPLFSGPIDVIGDVHGEIDALRALVDRLGYRPNGEHPAGRHLVFVGDLVDRGPDSPAVLRFVMPLVAAGCAQCVLGNHELNILLGRRKKGNSWYFGEDEPVDRNGRHMRQRWADRSLRQEFDAFLCSLPLALERADLRVVHACWHTPSIAAARTASNNRELYEAFDQGIRARLAQAGLDDPVAQQLARQNENPVKVLSSGLEEPARAPFESGGKLRVTKRMRWWDCYEEPIFTVFGHYWRYPVLGDEGPPAVFDLDNPYSVLGTGNSTCIDYSVGGRWFERHGADFNSNYRTSLAALRYPERKLWLDNSGTAISLNESR